MRNAAAHACCVSRRQEIDDLQKKVVSERESYQVTAQDKNAISAVPHFSVNDKLVLNRDDASYTLSLEVQMALDNVLLQVPSTVVVVDADTCGFPPNPVRCVTAEQPARWVL